MLITKPQTRLRVFLLLILLLLSLSSLEIWLNQRLGFAAQCEAAALPRRSDCAIKWGCAPGPGSAPSIRSQSSCTIQSNLFLGKMDNFLATTFKGDWPMKQTQTGDEQDVGASGKERPRVRD